MTETTRIPFAVPDIGPDEVAAVTRVLESGWLTTGPETKAFEREFAAKVGATHAVALNSCTAALHLALEAIGVGPSDEVIVPTLTFAATAEVVRYLGAKPVLVDVLPGDHQVDPSRVAAAVSDRTKAVVPVHFGGQACELAALREIAEYHHLRVIEDAAHALPASYRGAPIGAQADVACFSFYATKTITTGEGGMAVTCDPELEDRMRIMSLHGISRDAWKRYTASGSWRYDIIAPGFKYNMADMAAAVGRVQLGRADAMRERREAIAHRYLESLSGHEAFEPLSVRADGHHAWHLFVIKVRNEAWSIGRDALIDALKEAGVGTSVHFIPLHCHSYYRDMYGYAPGDFPVAHDVFERSLSLPIYSSMTDAQVGRVLDVILDLAARHRR